MHKTLPKMQFQQTLLI